MSDTVEKKPLHKPSLEEVSTVWKERLSTNFEDVEVEVVECPDLTGAGWGLASAGLGGSPKVGSVGGVGYLAPLVNKDKYYNAKDILTAAELPHGLMLGAGGSPYRSTGVNGELAMNSKVGSNPLNKSAITYLSEKGVKVHKLPQCETCFGIMLDFFACKGEPGPVIKVVAKKRKGDDNFIGCLRKALTEKYGDKPVGFGGTFRMLKGSAHVHIMPPVFSEKPLNEISEVLDWLKYFDFAEPMVFMTYALSKDPDLQMNLEHSHGNGTQYGGHYEYDVTPDIVEYEGYFNIAEEVVRMDRPPKM